MLDLLKPRQYRDGVTVIIILGVCAKKNSIKSDPVQRPKRFEFEERKVPNRIGAGERASIMGRSQEQRVGALDTSYGLAPFDIIDNEISVRIGSRKQVGVECMAKRRSADRGTFPDSLAAEDMDRSRVLLVSVVDLVAEAIPEHNVLAPVQDRE
ncbi:hypothetical protein VTI74DRAFT_3618 [Chaetomium olivicolor]